MSLGLQLTVQGRGQQPPYELFFPRPPVLIGRGVAASQCVIDDPLVSKLHASVDLRSGTICVRDVGSTNGTYAAGRRLEVDRWIPLAATNQVVDLQISAWTIRVQAYALDEVPSSRAGTLAKFVEEDCAPSRVLDEGARRTMHIGHTVAIRPSPAPVPLDRTVHDAKAQLASPYAAAVAALHNLYEATARLLGAAPPEARFALCQQLGAMFPVMMKDPSFLALFRHHGWAPSSSFESPSASLASAALDAMQELARWYLGADRVLGDTQDVAAFKERLRASLDELLLGYVPLVAGLERFEHQMALRQDANAPPRSPADLARQLLEWNDRTDDAIRRIRAGFADLMMHQVALLNGLMRGVTALLTELSPTTIEKAAQRKVGRVFFLFRLFARRDPWSVYKERHSDLTDEENERFRLLFGPDFAEEYRQFAREARSSGAGQGSTRPPSMPGEGSRGSLPAAALPIPGKGRPNSGTR